MAWPPAMPRVPMASASTRSISSRALGADRRRRLRQHFERARLQRVADQDRGGFIECAMAGRPAAAQVVVVHGRQIVVHEAVDVDQLDRRRGRVEQLERRAQGFAGCVHQHRPHAFAAGERAVAHGLEQSRGRARRRFRARARARPRCAADRAEPGWPENCGVRTARRQRRRRHRRRRHRRMIRSILRRCARAALRLSVARCASAVWHWRVSATPRSKVFSASSSGTSPCSSFATSASSSVSDCSKSGDLFQFLLRVSFSRARR